jgi:hypothetical protein
MKNATLFERLGGAVGVDAVVRALHARVEADPDVGALVDDIPSEDLRAADTRALTRILGSPSSNPADCHLGVLVTMPEAALRHLRDTLWMLGASRALVEEVAAAVSAAIPGSGPAP